ncbi:hypothetical protein K1719_004908 [Acacia pycnantha]|nr:hypothetical protein K1719_004908 [Acacia pycnantha]
MKRHPKTLADFRDRSQQYLDLEQMEMASPVIKERAKSPPPGERNSIMGIRKTLVYVILIASPEVGKQGNKCQSGGRSKSPPAEKKRRDQRKKAEDSDVKFPEAKYDCNVISSGFGGGGDSTSQQRKYLREVLSIRDHLKFKEELVKPDPPMLCFSNKDLEDVAPGHHDGLVITGTLVNYRVKKIFVDNGSADTRPKGYVDLKLTLGDEHAFKSEKVRFVVADFPSPYNIILGRPTIHNWDMLVVKETKGDPTWPQRVSKSKVFEAEPVGKSVNMVELDLRKEEKMQKTEMNSELEDLVLGTELGQVTKIGKALDPEIRAELEGFLKNNKDVFAWHPSEIPGVDPNICCHQLAIRPGFTPVAQKKRKIGEDRRKALETHVEELLEAGFIREVQYTTWLL